MVGIARNWQSVADGLDRRARTNLDRAGVRLWPIDALNRSRIALGTVESSTMKHPLNLIESSVGTGATRVG